MLMGTFMKANGSTTKPMALEYTFIIMVRSMRATGWIIFKMEQGLNSGQMVVNTRGNTNKERSMVKEYIHGQTVVFIRVIGTRIK